MISGQKKVTDLCERIFAITKENGLPEELSSAISGLKDLAKEQELVVPVVGAFSAGKSTLINACLGTRILPEAITPETSLATELHYSSEEYAAAFKKDGSFVRYATTEMNKLKKDAAQYVYARLYLNKPALREIEPLVLVDMPGFDSPLDQHNTAIMEYLERGCYYIVLSSVEEGTPTKSLLRRIRELDDRERDFSFFLSKSNLRSPNVVKDLVAYYEKTLSDNLDKNVSVTPLGDASGEELIKLIKSIDADTLFFNMYRSRIKVLCYDLIGELNTRISAAKKDVEKNKQVIAEMEESILKIQKKADDLVSYVKQRYSNVAVDDLVNSVGRSLDGALEELISVAVSGNQDEASRRINEIVRSSLSSALSNKLGDISGHIVDEFSKELSGLDMLMKDYQSESFTGQMADRIKTSITDSKIYFERKAEGDSPSAKVGWKTISTIFSISSKILPPVVELILVFLPEILSSFFKGTQEKKQRDALRSKFQSEIFPGVKRKIRAEMPGYLDKEIKGMVAEIRGQYEEKIKLQRAEITAGIETAKADAEEKAKQESRMEAALADAKKIANEVV
jgi:hypothetical protein